jgi:spoIIIJ-associated protein
MDEKILEIEGKSIDEAIEKACREFGVAREKLNIEIISEDSGGFLGMLSKKAKIKASLLSLNMDFAFTDNPKTKSESRAKIEPRVQQKKEVAQEKEQPKKQEEPAVVSISSSAQVSKAKELLEGILQRMSLQCRVTAGETPEKIILNIEGNDSGLLIGKRGQNLDALQYVLSKAINKSDNQRKMIMVDAEEYRKRREESLLSLAERIRQKVKKTHKSVSLGHMSAHDRRIIHLALQEDSSLTTKSRGEGDYKKIIILPVKKGNSGHNAEKPRR